MRRLVAPIALIVLGVWLLSGCVYVPMFGRPIEGKDVARKVGDAGSRKPIRVGKSNDSDIRRIIGQPYRQSADGRVLAYTWKTQNGLTIWPLCFYVDGVDRWSTLVLRLDDKGVLKSREILRNNEPAINLFDGPAHPPLPPEMEQQWAP